MTVFRLLLKKELQEKLSVFLINPRTGKRYGPVGLTIAGVIALLILAGVSVQFYAYADMLAVPMAAAGVRWLYYALMGIFALVIGTVGGLLMSYSALYRAKDNEFLLSLPIPPSAILFSRVTAVFASSLLFTAIVWLPAVVRYWILRMASFAEIVFPIILLPFLAALATVVSCLLGWLAALAAGVIRNKSAAVFILLIGITGLYLFFCVRVFGLLQTILTHPEVTARFVQSRLTLFHMTGCAAIGDPLYLLGFILITVILSAVCMFVLSRTFIRIVTSNRGVRGKEYRERTAHAAGAFTALYRREVKHYYSSTTWLMNTSFGVFFLIAGAIAAVISRGQIHLFIEKALEVDPTVEAMIPAAIAAAVCMIVSMDFVTAAAVSLEGKELWIVRSFPCRAWDVLRAKECIGVTVNLAPAAAAAGVIGFAAGCGPAEIILIVLTAICYAWFSSNFGLFLNLMVPNLVWTNEAIPVKQSIPTFFAMFGGGLTAIAILAGSFALRNAVSAIRYLIICIAVFLVLTVILRTWIRRRGTEIFEGL